MFCKIKKGKVFSFKNEFIEKIEIMSPDFEQDYYSSTAIQLENGT